MTEERNHATIHDYLATLSRRKFVILGVMIVAAAAAGALSFSQKKTYSATSSLQALDLSQTAGFAQLQQPATNVPATTSAQLAQTAVRSDVLQAVKHKLKLPGTISQIRSNLSVSEDQQSNFVLVTASASTATGASALANTVATAVTTISNQDVKSHFDAVAKADNQAATALLLPFAGKKFSQLSASQQTQFTSTSQEAQTLSQLAARLEGFSKVASVSQVQALASVPASPSSPHPVSTIILGALLGFIVALLVVWYLESTDRRLRRPDETESVLGLPVIGALPPGSLGQTPGQSDAVGLPAFRMIGTQVRFLAEKEESEGPRSLLVTSAMSGEGKTTVSVGLALAAAAGGVRTLLIEADVHRPVHSKRLGLNAGPGLADYLRGRATPADILQSHTFADGSSNVRNGSSPNGHPSTLTCITAGDVAGFHGAELGSQNFADVITEVKHAYELVVIDSAPLLAVAETSELVALVDAVVLCLRLGSTTVEQARGVRAALERLPTRPTGVVLTDLARDLGGYYGYAYEYAGSPEPAATS